MLSIALSSASRIENLPFLYRRERYWGRAACMHLSFLRGGIIWRYPSVAASFFFLLIPAISCFSAFSYFLSLFLTKKSCLTSSEHVETMPMNHFSYFYLTTHMSLTSHHLPSHVPTHTFSSKLHYGGRKLIVSSLSRPPFLLPSQSLSPPLPLQLRLQQTPSPLQSQPLQPPPALFLAP